MMDYASYQEFCETPRQEQVFALLVKGLKRKDAAKNLGITRQSVDQIVERVKKIAATRLYSPDNGLIHPVQEGFTGDYTIQRDGEGKTERTWIKGKANKEDKERLFRGFVEGLGSEIVPVKPSKISKAISKATDMLATAIIFGDAHLGMLAEAVATLAEDHDLGIGVEDIRLAIDYCVACAPASKIGIFVNVGDWSHSDNTKNQTFKGTPLDSVNHFATMRAGGAMQRYAIDSMLNKFEEVIVINARGNHDNDTAFALNYYLEAIYENEPRVTIQNNESKFNFIEFGKCLIGINHGDGINANRLAGVMTKQQAEAWGRTTFRRWWMGHIHHKQMFEHDSGVTLESFHTLAPIDYWHSAAGYGAERRVTMLTLHKEFGEVNRMSPSLELIRAQQAIL